MFNFQVFLNFLNFFQCTVYFQYLPLRFKLAQVADFSNQTMSLFIKKDSPSKPFATVFESKQNKRKV